MSAAFTGSASNAVTDFTGLSFAQSVFVLLPSVTDLHFTVPQMTFPTEGINKVFKTWGEHSCDQSSDVRKLTEPSLVVAANSDAGLPAKERNGDIRQRIR